MQVCDSSAGECTVEPRRVVDEQRKVLRRRILEFRETLLQRMMGSSQQVPMYVGVDIACGLPQTLVDSIVNNCEYIHTVTDLEGKCIVWYSVNGNYWWSFGRLCFMHKFNVKIHLSIGSDQKLQIFFVIPAMHVACTDPSLWRPGGLYFKRVVISPFDFLEYFIA